MEQLRVVVIPQLSRLSNISIRRTQNEDLECIFYAHFASYGVCPCHVTMDFTYFALRYLLCLSEPRLYFLPNVAIWAGYEKVQRPRLACHPRMRCSSHEVPCKVTWRNAHLLTSELLVWLLCAAMTCNLMAGPWGALQIKTGHFLRPQTARIIIVSQK